MYKRLDNINTVKDLKKLKYNEKEELSKELRDYVIDIVSKTGGHLASNLGVVELTIALHSVLDVPNDKIIWDVGHQTYIHKILTGRKEKIKMLRKLGGISGFPKTEESECDCFNTGHSSTSISAALGMARARDIKKENSNIVAVIGDGSLTGGTALEALNDAGNSDAKLIIILNDNEMSISKNVGGIPLALGKIRTRKVYTRSNNLVKNIVNKIPFIGKHIVKSVRKLKYSIKQLLIPNMLFEDMGFRYFGPIDGHNIEKLERIIKISKNIDGPVLIHIVTKKGKGYKFAEENPGAFHGTAPFNIETGKRIKKDIDDYSKIFGNKLVELAKKNEKIVAVTASMRDGTGLTNFSSKFPNRFFDVGIAEGHAISMAAGMAKNGMIPVVPIYSSFFQRAYDQIIHDICMQKLPIVLCFDRAGVVGSDGETHQGVFDLSFLNIIPNLNILAPKDFEELEQMLEYSVNANSPIAIRYPRGGEAEFKFDVHELIEEGKAEKIKEGTDITILAIGKMVSRAMEVAKELEKEDIYAEIINIRFLNPLDTKTIMKSINKTNNVITIEDNIKKGGLATSITEVVEKEKIENVKIKSFGYPQEYIKQGTVDEIEKIYGLDKESIVKYCKKNIMEKI